MVASADSYNFTALIDEFLALRPLTGPHAEPLKSQLRSRARELLGAADAQYMPAFKILDLISNLVNLAHAIDREPQLRLNEARALLRESLSATTPLIHQFHLDAALERARYEPMMLSPSAGNERDQLLQQRWSAMRTAHQAHESLPPAWMEVIERTVEAAIVAPEFAKFRPRPLLQLFAEMLATARKLHQAHTPLTTLVSALAPGAALWKRYALKQSRYREPPECPPEFADFPTIH